MNKGVDYIGNSVVYFCHDGAGNFLMQKRGARARDEQGRWDIGAGGIEFDEAVEATLKREILEEYGTEVLGFEFLGYRDLHRENQGKKTHWIGLDFKVLVDHDSAKNAEPEKFDDIGWFTLGTLPSPLHSQLPIFFEKYKGKL